MNLFLKKTSAYISQYALHTPEMTVRETIDFSARCRGLEAELVDETVLPYTCKKGHTTNDPLIKYKLDVEVYDGDDTAKFVLWGNPLDELFLILQLLYLRNRNSLIVKCFRQLGLGDPQEYPLCLDDIMEMKVHANTLNQFRNKLQLMNHLQFRVILEFMVVLEWQHGVLIVPGLYLYNPCSGGCGYKGCLLFLYHALRCFAAYW
ncbi:pleiotropic drug resistance [Trifolium repens]|nr:pleiotropic drug resistance [Trifolium repens]